MLPETSRAQPGAATRGHKPGSNIPTHKPGQEFKSKIEIKQIFTVGNRGELENGVEGAAQVGQLIWDRERCDGVTWDGTAPPDPSLLTEGLD